MHPAVIYLLCFGGLQLASLSPRFLASRTRIVLCHVLINVDTMLSFNTNNMPRVHSKQIT